MVRDVIAGHITEIWSGLRCVIVVKAMIEAIAGTLERWFGPAGVGVRQLYLVGGSVRDLLLGHTPKDLDLVCRKARETAADIARHTNASLVPMEKKPDEPCYRIVDRTFPGSYIDLAEMRGRDIAEDLGNRDFTINAMAIEIQNGWSAGRLIDPLQGAEDIRDKKVRMASGRAMTADPLRILRAVRHAAQLDFSIDERTLEEMHAGAGLLVSVSAERVLTELLLILEPGRAAAWFKVMDDIGILPVLFPEIVPMKSCGQNG
ncbi:MAG TPA: hypothetical protein VEP69_05090, partial [Thermodesulfovibrionales bacterium]|nr:hypothetical protein [Thermodesulfovibrionales bacterium]